MTKKEIIKRFPNSMQNPKECFLCAYVEHCDKILPGFIMPRKCGGPFYESKKEN